MEQSGAFVPCNLYLDESHCQAGDLNTTARCGDGYQGTACSQCADEHYRLFAKCYPCEKWAKLKNIVLVVVLVLCWVVTNN